MGIQSLVEDIADWRAELRACDVVSVIPYDLLWPPRYSAARCSTDPSTLCNLLQIYLAIVPYISDSELPALAAGRASIWHDFPTLGH